MRYNASLTKLDDGATRAHLVRYFFARGFVSPGDTVMDAACGTGYGSRLLADVAETVCAVDQLENIKEEWQQDNIMYLESDMNKKANYPEVDILVSLETLEHLETPEVFIDMMKDRIKKFFIYSVPLNEEPGANPFHLQTFTKNSILALVERTGMKHFHTLMQGNHYIGAMYR